MNILIDNISHELIKTSSTDSYIEYSVYRADALIGYVTKTSAEVLYTARDVNHSILNTGATIRDALELMILNMFYSSTYTGERHIKTLGPWVEGGELAVEYVKNDYVKHAKRVVRYSKAAGDLYIVIDNNKYFYYEFK